MNQDLQPASAPQRQTTTREFLAVLFRRKFVILGLFIVTTATVVTISITSPVEYIASGRVLLKRGEKQSALSPGRALYSDWEEDMGSEVEVVRSAPVLDRTRALLLEQAGPGRPSRALNPRQVDVEVLGRTNVLAIGYRDNDPQTAKQVCDALVLAYVEFRQNDFTMAYPKDFFSGEMKRVQDDLNHWVTMRRNFATHSDVVDLVDQKRSAIESLGLLERRRSEIQADLAEAEASWRKVEELRANQNIDLPTFTGAFSNEAALLDLKGKIVNQELRLAELRENMRDDSPEVLAVRGTLDTLRAIMGREVDARVSMSKARVEVVRARLAVVNRDYAACQALLESMPEKEMSLGEMDRKIDLLKTRYGDMSRNSDLALITQNTSPLRNVVLLSRPGNATPSNARDYVRLALAPAFSIVVGIGLAFFLDGLDLTVRTAHHAEEAIELPVLATLVERRRRRSPVAIAEGGTAA
jgi:uncharacterized protein involved in exopolysaccharide biosynthesis